MPFGAEGKLPETKYREYAEKGYHITAVAGWNKEWRYVMSLRKDKAWGVQKVSPLGPINWAWIQEQWREGFNITSMAGSEDKEGKGQYVVVMTKTSPDYQQFPSGVSADPMPFMKEKWAEGRFVSAIAGCTSKWRVVMDQRSQGMKQRLWFGRLDNGFPFDLAKPMLYR